MLGAIGLTVILMLVGFATGYFLKRYEKRLQHVYLLIIIVMLLPLVGIWMIIPKSILPIWLLLTYTLELVCFGVGDSKAYFKNLAGRTR